MNSILFIFSSIIYLQLRMLFNACIWIFHKLTRQNQKKLDICLHKGFQLGIEEEDAVTCKLVLATLNGKELKTLGEWLIADQFLHKNIIDKIRSVCETLFFFLVFLLWKLLLKWVYLTMSLSKSVLSLDSTSNIITSTETKREDWC